MIRWNYLLPRLMILLLAGIGIRLAANPSCQSIVIESLQAITGSKVQVENTNIGFYPPIVEMTRLQIADPRKDKTHENLIEIDQLKLELDAEQLLKRSLVVNRATAEGILIHSMREDSGYRPELDSQSTDPKLSKTDQFTQSLLSKCLAIETEFNDAIQNLSCVKTAAEIKNRWQSDFAAIEAEIEELKSEAKQFSPSTNNPLRNLEQANSTLASLKDYQQSLLAIQQKIAGLPAQIQRDQQVLLDAKDQDLSRLKAKVPLPNVDREALNLDLLQDTAIQVLNDAKTYLEYGETLAHYTFVSPESERSRGRTFAMNDSLAQPPYIRECLISGYLRHRGEHHQLTATMKNLPRNKNHMASPCRIQMTLQGASQLKVEYALQKKGDRERSQLTAHWPHGRSDNRNFGLANTAGIQWEASSQEIWLQLKKESDVPSVNSFSGRLINIQKDAKLSLGNPSIGSRENLLRSLEDHLHVLDEIQIDISFSNKNGDWRLQATSNLTPLLAEFSDNYIKRRLDLARENSTRRITQAHAEKETELKAWFADRQSTLLTQLESTNQTVQRMKDKVIQPSMNPDAYLSRLREKTTK